MDENDEEHKEITVIHQICDLPLYHTKYHVVVSKNPILAKEHIEDLYPGIIMNFNKKLNFIMKSYLPKKLKSLKFI